MAKQNIFKLAKTMFKNQKILGVFRDDFFPLSGALINSIINAKENYEKLLNDPNYKEMKEILEKQKKAAEELIASGNLQDSEWIKENIHVLTDDEIIKNEVYEWLNDYVKTPEGQANLAYALVNEAGGGDNQMEIELGTTESLNGAGGWGSWKDSHVQLGEKSWQQSGDWNRNFCLPHEIRHVGQQEIPNLSQREAFLYHAGIVEADARLTEFCDGVTDKRNPKAKGYSGSLKKIFEKEILPKRDQFLGHTKFKNWKEFLKLRETDPETYKKVMGRIKEVEFKAVLNKLMTTQLYQSQGAWVVHTNGTGNINGLRAWVEKMCDRQGMRFQHVWPTVYKMATGQQVIPGMEGAFDASGRMTTKGRIICTKADLCCQGWKMISSNSNGDMTFKKDGVTKSYSNGNLRSEVHKDRKGQVIKSSEYTYDERNNCTSQLIKDGQGNVTYSVEYTYDERNNCTSQLTKDGQGNVTTRTEYAYYEKDKLAREVIQDGQGNVIRSTDFIYDDEKNQTGWVEKDGQGNVTNSAEYTYDANNKRTGYIIRDGEGKLKDGSGPAYEEAKRQEQEKEAAEKAAAEKVAESQQRNTQEQVLTTENLVTEAKTATPLVKEENQPKKEKAHLKKYNDESFKAVNSERVQAARPNVQMAEAASVSNKPRQRVIDNQKGLAEGLKAMANYGHGWNRSERNAKGNKIEERRNTDKLANRHIERRADKTADKRYYGNRPGGVDDTIAKIDTQERAKMIATNQTNKTA